MIPFIRPASTPTPRTWYPRPITQYQSAGLKCRQANVEIFVNNHFNDRAYSNIQHSSVHNSTLSYSAANSAQYVGLRVHDGF
jgi:hypothetical protein